MVEGFNRAEPLESDRIYVFHLIPPTLLRLVNVSIKFSCRVSPALRNDFFLHLFMPFFSRPYGNLAQF